MFEKMIRFVKDSSGALTAELVAIMSGFILLTFFIIEIAIAIFWVGTAEKAAQLGARLAVISTAAVNGLPAINELSSTDFTFGQSCSIGACTGFETRVCSGGTAGDCNADNFSAIVDRMRAVFGGIENENVTIEYSYVGLGFAGGPAVPLVAVTVSDVSYGAVLTTILGQFFGGDSVLTTLPEIRVTLTGEDLNSFGAS